MARSKKSRKNQNLRQKQSQGEQPVETNQEELEENEQNQPTTDSPQAKKKKQNKLPISTGGFGVGLVILGYIWPFLWGINVATLFNGTGRPPSMMSDSALGFFVTPVFFLVGGIVSIVGWGSNDGRIPGIIGTLLTLPVVFLVCAAMLPMFSTR